MGIDENKDKKREDTASVNCADDHDSPKLEELLTELSECRDDERNSQNQIVQVVAVACTALSFLFGASNLLKEKMMEIHGPLKVLNNALTFSRSFFYLSVFMFCVAFAYIMVLGVGNVLRYHYVQELEDQIYKLNKSTSNNKESTFLHWGNFSAPLITRNVKHLSSSHALLVYVCYTIATCSVVIFCIGIILTMYLTIENRKWYDRMTLVLLVIYMGICFWEFMRTSNRAHNMADYCKNTAIKNRRVRTKEEKQEEVYSGAKDFRYLVRYLIYPKIQDLEKPMLIVGIFVLFSLSYYGLELGRWNWRNLGMTILVFDALAYQARYQLNDIRGIKEDKEAQKKDRLLSIEGRTSKYVIKLSLKVALFKYITAFVISAMYGGALRGELLVVLALLLIITTGYEYARKKEQSSAVFMEVGIGYTLRCFVAIYAANPSHYNRILSGSAPLQIILAHLLLWISFWAYGCFSAILPWTQEVSQRMQNGEIGRFSKFHYNILAGKILNRLQKAGTEKINETAMPLREKGEFKDIWNAFFLTAILLSECAIFTLWGKKPIPLILIILEAATVIMVIRMSYFAQKEKIALYAVSLFAIVLCKTDMTCNINNVFTQCGKISLKSVFEMLQLLMIATYFVLRYKPQFKPVDWKRILQKVKRAVVGDEAWEILNGKKKD